MKGKGVLPRALKRTVSAGAVLLACALASDGSRGLCDEEVFPGADENTPSRAFYFDWINSQYEGSTENETLINMDFFKWLHEEYGMVLDIYSLDVGNMDDGPYTAGVGRLIPDHYGNLDSEDFMKQFPNGFGPLCEKARSFGCRLGIWLGPDGFGDTPEEEQRRTDMLVKLCREHHFILFKFDAVAGGLRPEKQDAFIRALKLCRIHCPDLIALNERVELGKAASYVTTDLWEGAETYIDVFSSNEGTATHHRAGALSRELTPGLNRLMEDHGVCLSSCLDFWEDDLVLQAFNRSLILAPEIYGSPWLLRDDEFPKLARIFNLHRRHRAILVNGVALPEDQYGPFAVSRGDGRTRFITLRNLTWNPVRYAVRLDESLGLIAGKDVDLRRFHPSERILGRFGHGSEVKVEVPPFRSCLLMASTEAGREVGVTGCDFEVIRDLPGKPVLVKLLGLPGTQARIGLISGGRRFDRATLDGEEVPDILQGGQVSMTFPGLPLKEPWHRKIAELEPGPVPPDAEALYEATCFAADSNALEVRSLMRSGPTRIPQVERARRIFFDQPFFTNRGIWDRNLFDGDMDTFFIARWDRGALRVDFGEAVSMDRVVIKIMSKYEHDLNPVMHRFAEDAVAEVSRDLKTWIPVGRWRGKGYTAIAKIPSGTPVRYLRINGAPRRIAEVEGYREGARVDRSKWRASNLFSPYSKKPAEAGWSGSFVLEEIPEGSYLAIALHGCHGDEGAYAAVRVDGEPLGAPDRSVSFPSNTWEYFNVERESNYTYYVPLTDGMGGKKIDAVVLVLRGGVNEFKPEVYLTAYPTPFTARELVLTGNR